MSSFFFCKDYVLKGLISSHKLPDKGYDANDGRVLEEKTLWSADGSISATVVRREAINITLIPLLGILETNSSIGRIRANLLMHVEEKNHLTLMSNS